MKTLKWISICAAIIGVIGYGANLLVGDGITHPTHLLTAFAVLICVGLLGMVIVGIHDYVKKQKEIDEAVDFYKEMKKEKSKEN